MLQYFTGPLSRNFKYIFGFLDSRGGGLGDWSQKCMECPQVGREVVFSQTTSNLTKLAVHILYYAKGA